MKQYKLTIYLDEKTGLAVHEEADPITAYDARLIISALEEYKQRLLGYIMINEQHQDLKKEAKKVE